MSNQIQSRIMTSGAQTTFHSTTDLSSDHQYYLFSSKSCPYAHRVEIVRNLKNLNHKIKILYCNPAFKFDSGWSLDYQYTKSDDNPFNFKTLMELYKLVDKNYSGRASLPVLYDNTSNQIINNESSQIIKIFNDYDNDINLYPPEQQQQIDNFCQEFNQRICTDTYKAGHAKSVEEYEKLFNMVFEYLDHFNDILKHDFIMGENLTLADIHAYPHLIRFDCIFYHLFALNKKHLWEYENIGNYLKRLSNISAFKNSVDLEEMKRGSYLCENNYIENMGCKKIPHGFGGSEKFFQ